MEVLCAHAGLLRHKKPNDVKPKLETFVPILKYRPGLNGAPEGTFLATAKAIWRSGKFSMAALGTLEAFRPSYPF